ncbi:MAG: rod shape-determining protein [Ruminococcaceae bacterium]|nr:rod shape-determining protein [Oscillospiraceae bacterium]
MNYTIGLDLGTHYTRIWKSDEGVVLRCPTAAAIDSRTHQVVALGSEACRMIGKTPEHILAYRPVVDGLITDFEVAARMVTGFFDAKRLCTLFKRPAVMVAAPYYLDQVHQLAAENAVLEAGARSVAVIPAVYAAAAGEGLDVRSPRAHLVLSMGGGVAEAAIISSGNVIHAKTLRVAGDRLNMAIVSYLKNRYHLLIGDNAAEALKLRLGTADPSIDRGQMVVRGRNARTKLAESRAVDHIDICEAIKPAIEAVARLVDTVVQEAPHELERELYGLGIMLTGGSALLPGLGKALSQKTGMRVVVSKNPLDAVVNGLGRIARNPQLLGDPIEFRRR